MAQQLRACAALAEGRSFVPSTHTRELTTLTTAPRASIVPLSARGLYMHLPIDIHIIKIEILNSVNKTDVFIIPQDASVAEKI